MSILAGLLAGCAHDPNSSSTANAAKPATMQAAHRLADRLRDPTFTQSEKNPVDTFGDPLDLAMVKKNPQIAEEVWLDLLTRYGSGSIHGGGSDEEITGHYTALGAAYLIAYFKMERALPILRESLLSETYFYGWETNAPHEETLMWDTNYPHHWAYLNAIEAITARPAAEYIQLTADEKRELAERGNVWLLHYLETSGK